MKKILVCLWIFVAGTAALWAQPARNAVWLIADGVGPGTMGFFMQAVRNTTLDRYPDKQAVLEQFINASTTGFYFNNTYDTIVTDSACAATQMACGKLSRPHSVGIDEKGKPMESLLEEAYKQGKSIGVVTDVYVTDATPAGFLAHTSNRKDKYSIAKQLIDSQAQVILGGGLQYFTKKANKKLLTHAKKQGWQLVQNKAELSKVTNGRIIGLFAEKEMPFYSYMKQYPNTPTLREMTQKAVELLSQNPKGFVLLVEAGKADWVLHENEAGPVLWEMVNLDETLGYLWNFAKQDGQTLLYLNADHATGMPAFDYRDLDGKEVGDISAGGEVLYYQNKDYIAYPYYQRLWAHTRILYYVYQEFKKLPLKQQTADKLQKMVDEALGVPTDLHLAGKVPSHKELIDKLNRAQKLVWATKTHSSEMLLGVAYGPGAEHFSGVYHNTDLKGKFEKAFGW